MSQTAYLAKEQKKVTTMTGTTTAWVDKGVYTDKQMALKWKAEDEENRTLWTYPLLDTTFASLAVQYNNKYEG